MKLLLVRHAESTGNVAGIWAGITDSELTVHGFEQAKRLGEKLAKMFQDKSVSASVLSSPLTRAFRTGTAIAQRLSVDLVQTSLLEEQNLGWREGLLFKQGERTSANEALAVKNPGESKSDMDTRARAFIAKYLNRSISEASDEKVVIVVSHGLFLLRLYYQLCEKWLISYPPSPSWSNTGITTISVSACGLASVTDVNNTSHLEHLKRTKLVGSSAYSPKQKRVSDFFVSASSAQSVKKIKRASPCDVSHLDMQAEIAAIDAACSSKS